MNVGWTPSERFSSRRLLIEGDPERWDALLRAIADDITTYPSPYGYLPGTDWRTFKVRPGTEGFPGLTIYFTMREGGNSPHCVLEDVVESEDPARLRLTDYVAEQDTWVKSTARRRSRSRYRVRWHTGSN